MEAYALLNGKVNELTFRTTLSEITPVQIETPTRTLVADYVSVGNVILAYYTLADLVPEIGSDHVLWRSVRITPGQIRPLRMASGDFSDFVEYARQESNIEMFLVRRSPEDILARVTNPG